MSRVLAIAVVVASAVLAVLFAQPPDQLPVPTFRTEANYVRVDVFPTRDGAPIADLAATDFEVLEDRVPQKIEQFERVVIRAAGSGEGRPEPNTVAQSRQAIQDPRARVFVLFLDPKHVEQGTSRTISRTLVNALNRLIGPDDYVGVMVPTMKLRDVTFARRTVAIENLLRNDWWGQRDSILPADKDEEDYAFCYPAIPPAPGVDPPDKGIAQEMILRHREVQTFDALEDLVLSVRTLREERKAVLAITDGWLIYRSNSTLTRPLGTDPPGNPPLGIDRRSGRLSTSSPDPDRSVDATRRKCEIDRQTLSNIDDESRLRTIIEEANRSNTAFYPVDPRGLVVFDEGIIPSAAVGPASSNPTLSPDEDRARLRARDQGLRRLAEGTDGTAILGTNNIADALRRVIDDLSSYYLLGYYSSGKLDGKFHSISVRVKRPGVTVRARRGYQALGAADVERGLALRTPATPTSAVDAAVGGAASAAVAKVVNFARDMPLRVHVTAGWRLGADGRPEATFWTVGEVVDRIPGSDLEAVLMTAAGDIVASGRGRIPPGTTSALLRVEPGQPVQAGDYVVRVRSQAPAGAETVSIPVTLPAASQSSGAVFIRRGPTTGNKEMPTADLRFRRSERLRVEVPTSADMVGARLLDRTGKPLPVPVAAATRTDADGTRWATGELVLAPLAPADYVVEISAGEVRTMAAFRLVP
ncbi:MAG TPA: VWA domain-containing protein [Vicinamibacterales bacterium]|nr:VWA domain-containing protein [Vicinamibacterales bacterium]